MKLKERETTESRLIEAQCGRDTPNDLQLKKKKEEQLIKHFDLFTMYNYIQYKQF